MNVFVPLLSAVFIGLKLAGIIAWSWWWVLSPIWISAVLGLTATVILGLSAKLVLRRI